MIVGNLFQQAYTIVDSAIVGHYNGEAALAAVGASSALTTIFICVAIGGGIGASVIISQHFGAKRFARMKSAVYTALLTFLAVSVLLAGVGLLCSEQIMTALKTPPDALEIAVTYLNIYFYGLPFLFLYNILSSLFNALGKSRIPLYFLIFSAIVNTVLDLLFVGVLKLGVGSAALATIISQFISALLCLRRLLRSPEEYRLVPSRIRFDPIMLKQIISNGLPAGLQNSIIALANVVVQSNINSFGKMAVAGCGAYSKVEGFGFLPITCFSLALTTFISQNLGAKQYDRAKRGARFGILCSITLAEIVGICVYFLSPYLIAAFNSDPEVVAYGTLQAHTITLFYFLLAFSHCIAGIMRGAGKATVPMFVMLCCWCIIRVTYITIAVRIFPVINTIFWAYPLTWTLSSILFFLYYRKADWIHGFEKK